MDVDKMTPTLPERKMATKKGTDITGPPTHYTKFTQENSGSLWNHTPSHSPN